MFIVYVVCIAAEVSTRMVSEYKTKLQISEAENSRLEGTVSNCGGVVCGGAGGLVIVCGGLGKTALLSQVTRLKGQVDRYKNQIKELVSHVTIRLSHVTCVM